MAIKLGLTRKSHRRYVKTLGENHYIKSRVMLLDLSHKHIEDLSDRLIEGQVNIDAEADVTRSLDMVLYDPKKHVSLQSNSPAKTSLDINRMIKVVYSVGRITTAPEGIEWFDIPIFCGPITDMERNESLISITAQGKETMLFASMWRIKTFRKGLTKSTVIKRILNISGETRVDVPDHDERIPHHISIGYDTFPWKVANRVAKGLKRQLFYDGRGTARLRRIPGKTVFEFDSSIVKTHPKVGYNPEDYKNAVLVIGANPKGPKKRIRVRRVAPRSHPLSPWRMERNGVPQYKPLVIRDDSIRSRSKARSVAKKELRKSLVESVDVEFESLVIPHLEEMDVCRLNTEEFSMDFRMRKMTIPWTAAGSSSIGTIKRSNPKSRPIKGRRRKHHGRK